MGIGREDAEWTENKESEREAHMTRIKKLGSGDSDLLARIRWLGSSSSNQVTRVDWLGSSDLGRTGSDRATRMGRRRGGTSSRPTRSSSASRAGARRLWSMVYGLWSTIMVDGLWPMVYGLWSVIYGPWSVIYGLWSVMYGPWSVIYGLWSVIYGLWSIVDGSSHSPRNCRYTGPRSCKMPVKKL